MQIINADIVQSPQHSDDLCSMYVEIELDEDREETRIYKNFPVLLFELWEEQDFTSTFYTEKIENHFRHTLEE